MSDYHRIHVAPMELSDYAKAELAKVVLRQQNIDNCGMLTSECGIRVSDSTQVLCAMDAALRRSEERLIERFERGEMGGLA